MPADLDVALHPIALIVCDDLEVARLKLLIHRKLVDRERPKIEADRICRIGFGECILQRHCKRHDRRYSALARIGIDHRIAGFTQPVGLQNFGGRRNRSINAEPHLGRRRFRREVRHLEGQIRNVQPPAGGRIDSTLIDIDVDGTAADAALHVPVADDRQIVNRADREAGREEVHRQTIVRNRRPAANQSMHRRIHSNVEPLHVSAIHAFRDPLANLWNDQDRPDALENRNRHRCRRHAKRQPRLAGIIEASRTGHTDFTIADVALGQKYPAVISVETDANGNPVEDRGRFSRLTGQQDRAAAQTKLPVRNAVIRRLQMSQQRNAIGAGIDMKRSDHDAAAGIPFDACISVIEDHRIVGHIEIDDGALARNDLTTEIRGQTVTADLALEFTAKRHVRRIGEILQAGGEQQVVGRNLVRADIDRAHAVGWRADGDFELPAVLAFLTDTERDTAADRPPQAHTDVREVDGAAAALVLDHQRTIAQTDFVEAFSVEAIGAEAVEPVERGDQSACTIRCGGG